MRTLFISLFITLCAFSSLAQTTADSTKSNKQILTFVEVMPQFLGSEGSFQKFIASHLKYPADAKAQGIEGTVYVQYVVNVDGTLSDIKILEGRSLSPSCDQAVIDVIKKSPKWSPGIQNGQPVAVKMTQKVIFNNPYSGN